MEFKYGVEYTKPGVVVIMMAVEKVYNKHGFKAVITSLMDGRHRHDSKHYTGEAVDVRIWGFDEAALSAVSADLQSELGSDYDVVVEPTHIHIEYDPK